MTLICFTWWGCEENLDTITIQEEPQLCVNALWDNTTPTHRIYCSCISQGESTPVQDAVIEISVNGQLVETLDHPSDQEPGVYLSTCTMQTGDTLLLRAVSPAFPQGVWAEAIVPQPFVVTEASAEIEYQSFHNDIASPYYQTALSLQKQSPTAYYGRLLSSIHSTQVYGRLTMDFSTGDILEEFSDTLVTDSVFEVKVLDDLCLTQGKGYVENPEDDMLGYNPVWQNHYHLFTDKYFSGDTYLMHYYVSCDASGFSLLPYGSSTILNRNHPLYGHRYKVLSVSADGHIKTILYDKECIVNLFYEVHSISSSEYYYLQTLSAERDLTDTNMAYSKPRFIPQNVHNGLGFFAIENVTRGRISIEK